MVEKFNCYVHTPATRATGREIRQDGEFVLASDYAKLEARIAATNATLDRLRDVVPEDDRDKVFCSHCKTATRWHSEPDYYGKYCDDCDNENCDIPEGDELQSVIRTILYPTPETPNEH